MSSHASLIPKEIFKSAGRGELQKVVKWLRKGGEIDAFGSARSIDGLATTATLLHTAAAKGRLELVRELLKRGASVDLRTSFGSNALMQAAYHGHASVLLVLLQLSANPDLQDGFGFTALMAAALYGHQACVQALLLAKANAELLDKDGDTALHWAERKGHTAIAALLRQHAAPPQPAAAAPSPAAAAAQVNAGESNVSSLASLPFEIFRSAGQGEVQSVVKWLRKGGAIDARCPITISDNGQTGFPSLLHIAAPYGHLELVRELLKRRANVDLQMLYKDHGHTALIYGQTALQLAEDAGHTAIAELIRQHTAPPQPAHAVTPQAAHAEQAAHAAHAARADATMNKLLAEEAAEQAKAQAPSKKSKKKNKKAGRAAAAADEPSEAPPATTTAQPPPAAPEPAASAAQRAAIASGGLSALEAALAAAPREVREGGVGAEARARRGRLLEAQQEAEREAKQEAAAEAARLAAATQAQEMAARVAAVSKAREVAAAAEAAAAAAVAEADALERAMAVDGGGGGGSRGGGTSGGSGAAGPLAEAEVPDDFICPITAEIMTDPVTTQDGFTYEREAITEWLRTKDTSPKTGATLESKALIPNHLVRGMIRSFIEARGQLFSEHRARPGGLQCRRLTGTGTALARDRARAAA